MRSSMPSIKKIHVHYYAILKAERGLSQETIETRSATPWEVYRELKDKYHFRLPIEKIKVAINDEFADWQKKLNPGDNLIFIPPVAGG